MDAQTFEADIRDPRISADGRRVIFAAQGPAPALYSAPSDGSGPAVRLGGPLLSPLGCQWKLSADGRRVVYVGGDLYSVPVDGSSEPVRLSEPASGSVYDFTLGPDGARVVYRAAPGALHLGLFSVALDGSSAPTQLVAPNSRGDVRRSYAIDATGRFVVFHSLHEDADSPRLYRVAVTGGTLLPLTPPGLAIEEFRPSADRLRVLFRTPNQKTGTFELYTVPMDGTQGPVKLCDPLAPGADVQSFELSFDGAWVVFLSDRGLNGRNDLLSARTDASEPPVRLSATLAAQGCVTSGFQIDPGSSRVVYQVEKAPDQPLELYASAIDGRSEPVRLNGDLARGARVGWYGLAPDGKRVLYELQRGDGRASLCEARLDVPSRPVEFAQALDASAFQLGPNGRRLIYLERGSELRSASLSEGTSLLLRLNCGSSSFQFSSDGSWLLERTGSSPEEPRMRSRLLRVSSDGRVAPLHIDVPRRVQIEAPIDTVTIDAATIDTARIDTVTPPPPSAGRTAHTQAAPSPSSGAQPAAGGELPAVAGDVGFRDFSFGTSGSSTPTGEKPECKLWWNDGFWWGSLFNDATGTYHVYGLDPANQRWQDTGTVLDDRGSSKADVLWDGASQKLYVASHIFSTNAVPTASNWGRLLRYSYSTASKTYTLDPGFPVDITRGNAEDMTLAKDSTGRLWVTWVESARVMINHSVSSDADWGEPGVLPVKASAVAVNSDDISAIVAFGGNRIGVMWSNQVAATTYFAVHLDSSDVSVWQPEEVVMPDANCTSGTCSDDHFSLKASANGRVFAALKTDLQVNSQNQVLVGVRAPGGGWSTSVFGIVQEHHTRPVLLLDEQNGQVYVFVTNPENGGAIYYKSAPIDNLQFAPGQGTPFIQNGTDVTINNATSTKQNVNNTTDLVVLASDQNTRFYVHNFLDLGPAANPPTIGSFTPTSGPVGTTVSVNGSNFSGATGVRFNGTSAAFTVSSSSLIRTTVPSGASSGRITVTTPNGTATSASDFVVNAPPSGPTIGSFTPTSGPVGTTVSVSGSNFSGTTSVRFNGTSAAFTVSSSFLIRTTVPSGASSGRITVTTSNGTATSASDFIVNAPPSGPTIGSFTPTSGPVGTAVSVNGSNFSGTTSVRFNGTSAAFTVSSSSLIRTTVPSGASSGRITVTTSNGTATSANSFTVTAPPSGPTIGSFTPTSGPVGTSVSVNGSNFSGATSVRFNGTSAAFNVSSSSLIRATVPSGASSGRITVTTPNGTATSANSFTVTSPPGPTIGSFTPSSGPVGTTVSVGGINFNGATSVRFNGISAAFTVSTSNLIRATVPSGASSGRITVTTPNGTATSANSFTVTHPPIVQSFAPSFGVVATPVTIHGSLFQGASNVKFNGKSAVVFTVIDGSTIVAIVPFGATTGKISVTTSEGTGVSASSFTVIGP